MTFRTATLWVLVRRELRAAFDTPTAYVALLLFLLLWEFLFFRNVFLIGAASLRTFFDLLPWLSLLLIPALTMRSISQELDEGTIEFLLTRPVRRVEVVLAKYVSSLLLVAFALLLTLPLAFSLSQHGDLDWGVVVGQYLAALLLASLLLALGIFLSSRFRSAVSALLVTIVAGFALVILGFPFITVRLPLALVSLAEQLSVTSHFDALSRGVVDLRNVLYFITGSVAFLALATLRLVHLQGVSHSKPVRQLAVGTWLFVGIAVFVAILGSRIPGRLDLTEERLYTLAPGTRSIVSGLPDVVNVTLYASEELPAQLQPRRRDVADLLHDYVVVGKGNIILHTENPDADQAVATAAASVGIRPVQFNVIGNEEFQVKNGYLGLAVAYAGKTEVIPFIERTDDLEYQLTSFLRRLTNPQQKTVGFLSGVGEQTAQDIATFRSELGKQFTVKDVTVTGDTPTGLDGIQTLIVAGAKSALDEATVQAIQTYLDAGGSALFLVDGVTVDLQTLSVAENPETLRTLLEPYGITVQPNLVYDLRSNESVNFGSQGGFSFVLPYPFWARVIRSAGASPVTAGIESVVLPWSSAVTLTDPLPDGVTATTLFTTTDAAGIQAGSFSITPDQDFQTSSGNLGTATSAVAVTRGTEGQTGSRIIVVGDSDFLTEQFVSQSPENAIFSLNAVDWLSQEDALASIRSRSVSERRLTFTGDAKPTSITVTNYLIVTLVPLGIGLLRYLRRRSRMRQPYHA